MALYWTDLGVRSMSADQLDGIARDHAGVVGSIGYGHACRDHACVDTDLAGGWRVRWVDRRGMGNHGTLVLVPTDRRTRALLREGRVVSYTTAGPRTRRSSCRSWWRCWPTLRRLAPCSRTPATVALAVADRAGSRSTGRVGRRLWRP